MAKEIQLKENNTSVYPQLEYEEYNLQFESPFYGDIKCFRYGKLCYISVDCNFDSIQSETSITAIRLPEFLRAKMRYYLSSTTDGIYNASRCAVEKNLDIKIGTNTDRHFTISGFWEIK